MALSQRLEFRQSQALVMTPQLMQAIKLLQLSNLDLAAYVEGELERNPLLERSSEGPPEGNQREEAATEAPGEAADVNGSAAIEDSFETAKNEFGLDHNETRSWHGWHRHVSLVMLAFAMMAAIQHQANKPTPKKTISSAGRSRKSVASRAASRRDA